MVLWVIILGAKVLIFTWQDVSLPKFNETFLANLQTLRQQINESEWQVKRPNPTCVDKNWAGVKNITISNIFSLQTFESWMRNWLIFQMAQKTPPAPTPQPGYFRICYPSDFLVLLECNSNNMQILRCDLRTKPADCSHFVVNEPFHHQHTHRKL